MLQALTMTVRSSHHASLRTIDDATVATASALIELRLRPYASACSSAVTRDALRHSALAFRRYSHLILVAGLVARCDRTTLSRAHNLALDALQRDLEKLMTHRELETFRTLTADDNEFTLRITAYGYCLGIAMPDPLFIHKLPRMAT